MTDITIILPIHSLAGSDETRMLQNALESVVKNRENYTFGKLYLKVVCPKDIVSNVQTTVNAMVKEDCEILLNENETDFCSQVNFAAQSVNTDYFSILEFDDLYTDKWFSMVHEYFYSNEDVSIFLPINIQFDSERTAWQYCNELVWAKSFSDELGYIDFDCLQNCSTFNLTGGVFNTKDFVTVGGFKPSIKIAFNYELLLRMTNKKLRVFVVPKEGYHHLVNRNNSLTQHYLDTIEDVDIKRWFELAKCEYTFTEDRKTDISHSMPEELK